MIRKKMISAVLITVFAVMLCVPSFAVVFSDLNGHWAQGFMEDLAGKGYLTGYSDGTMGPEKNITSCEALAVLSRFYELDEESTEWINSDFMEYVTKTVPASLSWSYDELSVCLAAGIITRDELATLNFTTAIEKEQLSVFLVRGMQFQDEADALSGTQLSFDDADEIGAESKGSIAVLVGASIIKGDENNNFCPDLGVTRAVFATMVSRSLEYLGTQGLTLEIEGYEGVIRTDGIITEVRSGSLVLAGFDGLTREYTITSSTPITVNNETKSLTTSYIGCHALVSAKEGAVVSVSIESVTGTTWVQGIIYSLTPSSSTDYLYIKNLKSGASTKYTVPDGVPIIQNDKTTEFASLTVSNFATLKIISGVVSEVRSYTGDFNLTGTISDIEYATTTTMMIRDEDGIMYNILLNMSDLPSIKRGNTSISLDRLGAGDEVTVTFDNCEISSIATEGTQNTVTGELTSITTTAEKTTWTITTNSGVSNTYTVDESADVYSGDKSILISNISIGDTVSVVLYANTITEINLESSASASTKISGSVLAINSTSKEITILSSSGKLVYIDASSTISIISAKTGSAQNFSSIKADSNITAYGVYESSNHFKANSIIIES